MSVALIPAAFILGAFAGILAVLNVVALHLEKHEDEQ